MRWAALVLAAVLAACTSAPTATASPVPPASTPETSQPASPAVTPVPAAWGLVGPGREPSFLNPLGSSDMRAVAVRRSDIVAVGDRLSSSDGAIWHSTDGVSWTRTDLPSSTVTDIATDGTRFVAIGTRGSRLKSVPVVWLSEDATTWTASDLPNGTAWPDVAVSSWAPAHIVATSSGFAVVSNVVTHLKQSRVTIWSSANGTAWSAVDQPTFHDQVVGAAASGRRIIVAGSATVISSDGVHWVTGHAPFGSAGATSDVVALNGVFVAVGQVENHPAAATSTDGVTWTRSLDIEGGSSMETALIAVAKTPNGLVAAGGTTGDDVWTSVDGTSWQRVPGSAGSPIRAADVAATQDGLIVIGSIGVFDWSFSAVSAAAAWETPGPSGPDPAVAPPAECEIAVPLTALDVIGQEPLDRLACFGGETIDFQAWLAKRVYICGFGGCGNEWLNTLPDCLDAAGGAAMFGTCADGRLSMAGWFDSGVTIPSVPHPNARDRGAEPVVVTGHFDDPRLESCEAYASQLVSLGGLPDARTWCRTQFVVTDLEPVG